MDATAKAVCVCVCVQRERDGIYKGMDMYRKCSRTRMCCDIMGRSWQLLVILSTLYSQGGTGEAVNFTVKSVNYLNSKLPLQCFTPAG